MTSAFQNLDVRILDLAAGLPNDDNIISMYPKRIFVYCITELENGHFHAKYQIGSIRQSVHTIFTN